MNSEEFLNKVKESGVAIYFKKVDNSDKWYPREKWLSATSAKIRGYEKDHHFPMDEVSPDCCLRVEWRTGGTAGGSCWDDGSEEKHYGIEGDPEPEFEGFDKILGVFCPNISFLQYKKMAASGLIKRESRHENEYYGNSTNYGSKVVRLGDLYDYFMKEKLL